jgi:hypothetical protein
VLKGISGRRLGQEMKCGNEPHRVMPSYLSVRVALAPLCLAKHPVQEIAWGERALAQPCQPGTATQGIGSAKTAISQLRLCWKGWRLCQRPWLDPQCLQVRRSPRRDQWVSHAVIASIARSSRAKLDWIAAMCHLPVMIKVEVLAHKRFCPAVGFFRPVISAPRRLAMPVQHLTRNHEGPQRSEVLTARRPK